MQKRNRVLNVLMNGTLIGRLEKLATGALTFEYVPDWLNALGARPISLSLPLSRTLYSGEVVYHFFDNLLPDNPQIRARIQSTFKISSNQPFDLLASIGRDCVGAIQLIEGHIPFFKKEIQAHPLSDAEIAATLRGYKDYPLGMHNNNDEFRISIAGAQEKSAFIYHQKKWCRPMGETPTSHIFKLPIGNIPHQNMDLSDSCENEWLCSKIAEAFGLPVATCEILIFEDVKVLSVERFDRKLSSDQAWLMRLPQEDMCQTLGVSPNLKYQADGGPGINDIMRILLKSTDALGDRELFFRSQILFWLLAGVDGHAKNFSIFLEPGGQCRLTPLYDIMSAHPLLAKKQLQTKKIKMAMALRGKNNHYHWYNIQRRHFLHTADMVNYSVNRAEEMLDEMLGQVDAVIEKVIAQLPEHFPSEVSIPTFEGMRSIANRLKANSATAE
jgi:serine/threonine-protein kinase HipA